MTIKFKIPPIENQQHLLFPSNIYTLLPKQHDCWHFYDLIQQLDTSTVEETYSPNGQRGYHPKLISGILIYAYSRGVFSSRHIEQRCKEDLSFMYIAQMSCPNFRVLSDFRKDHADFFHHCFKQTVQLAMELKLASLGHISLDGTKFKANTSKHKAMSYGRLKTQEKELTEEIEVLIKKAAQADSEEDAQYKENTGYEIPEDLQFKKKRLEKITAAKVALENREKERHPEQDIDNKKQISFADTDANIMGKPGDGFTYNYNAQASVDSEHQIIVGQHISQKANDKQEVNPALEAIKKTSDRMPEKASLDNGYYSGNNLQALEKAGIDSYLAISKGERTHKEALDQSNRPLLKSDFQYDEEHDHFICPAGQILPLKQCKKDGRTTYQGEVATCQSCRYYSRCCRSKTGKARSISGDKNEALRQRMRKKMETDPAKAVYSHRKTIVEPVFGQIKNTGFRGFSLRGLTKVGGEFALICAVHNLKKILKKMVEGSIRPENGKLVNMS